MLLTAAEYPSIRAALDPSLTEEALPDRIIEYPIYGPRAELWLRGQDPLYLSRTGEAQVRVLNALILYTASLIAPALPAITNATLGSYSYARKAVDWKMRASELASEAAGEVAAVLTPGQSASRYPTMFAVAEGQRGR